MDVLETARFDFFPVVPPVNATGTAAPSTVVAGEFAQALAQVPEGIAADGALTVPAVVRILVDEISGDTANGWTTVIPWITPNALPAEVLPPTAPIDTSTAITTATIPVVNSSPVEVPALPQIPAVLATAIVQHVTAPAQPRIESDHFPRTAPTSNEEALVPTWVQNTLVAITPLPSMEVMTTKTGELISVASPVARSLPKPELSDHEDNDAEPRLAVPSFVIHTLPPVVPSAPVLPSPVPSPVSLPESGVQLVPTLPPNSITDSHPDALVTPLVETPPVRAVAKPILPERTVVAAHGPDAPQATAPIAVPLPARAIVRSVSVEAPTPAIIPVAESPSAGEDQIVPALSVSTQAVEKRSAIPVAKIAATLAVSRVPIAVDRPAKPAATVANSNPADVSGDVPPPITRNIPTTPATIAAVSIPQPVVAPSSISDRATAEVTTRPLTPQVNLIPVQRSPAPASTAVVATEAPPSTVETDVPAPAILENTSSSPTTKAPLAEHQVSAPRVEPVSTSMSVSPEVSKVPENLPSPNRTTPDEAVAHPHRRMERADTPPMPEARSGDVTETRSPDLNTVERTPAVMRTESLRTPAAALDFGDPVPIRHAEQLVQRLGDAIGFARDSGQGLSIRVTPPQFGPIVIEVRLHEGALMARVETHSAVAQTMITDHLPQLHESLAARGATLERIDVVPVEQRFVQERITPNERFAPERDASTNSRGDGVSSGTSERQGTDSQDQNRRRPPQPQPVPLIETPTAVAPAATGRPMELQGLNVRV